MLELSCLTFFKYGEDRCFHSCVENADFPRLKQTVRQVFYCFKSGIRKSQISLATHNSNTHCKVMQRIMAAKLPRLTPNSEPSGHAFRSLKVL